MKKTNKMIVKDQLLLERWQVLAGIDSHVSSLNEADQQSGSLQESQSATGEPKGQSEMLTDYPRATADIRSVIKPEDVSNDELSQIFYYLEELESFKLVESKLKKRR